MQLKQKLFSQIWTPQEYLKEMLSFTMLHRGQLSILVHPLGPVMINKYSLCYL